MSQKFILSGQKTVKKPAFFEQDKPKKFTRKRSERDRSFDSKKSKQDSVFSQYIRHPNQPANIKVSLTHDQSFIFFDQLDTFPPKAQQSERKLRKTMIMRTNNNRQPSRQQSTLSLRIKILQTQLKAKEGQCERYKLQLDEQKQRRRKAEFDRKAALKEASAYEKQNQELLLQIKKLNKEKQILNKQIQFLQKINYDQKTRNILSFRQKNMQEELFRLKEKLQSKQSPKQLQFLKQLQKINNKKEIAQQKFRAMESLVDVQKRCIKKLKEILKEQQIFTKQRIVNSQEYCELRDRFKRFIDQYKEVRLQNNNLKAMLENRQTQTQLVLSDSQTERL